MSQINDDNLTTDRVNTYEYDCEDQLTSIMGQTSSAYAYDALGRRISKTVDGVTTHLLYDGNQLIAEYDESDTLLKEYTYASGIDEILTSIEYPASSIYYYHYDGLGSVTDITDLGGRIVESYSHDAYGAPTQTSRIGNRFYFTGREFDEESGLYYQGASKKIKNFWCNLLLITLQKLSDRCKIN